MSFFKFSQIEISSKEVNDIFTMHLNKMVVSDKVPYNN